VATNVTNTNNVKGSLAVKFKNANKEYVVTGNSLNDLKVGGRIAKTIKREKLFRYAVKLGARPSEFVTIAGLCKLIFDRYLALRPKPKARAKTPSPSPSPSPSTANANANALASLRKFRLTSNLVEEDVRKFLGPQWIAKTGVTNASISKKAKELYELLSESVSTNKLNFNTKAIKDFKKTILQKWKSDTEVEIIRARYATLPYYPNVIKATQNFASTRNREGKYPKRADVLKYANVRSKVARNTNYFPLRALGKPKGVIREEL